jgi:hypothetical protein
MHQNVVILALSLLLYFLAVNSAFAKDQAWLNYVEPENKFELDYPSTWLVGNSLNQTSEDGLKFFTDNQSRYQSNEIMQVGIGQRNSELVAPGMNLNTTLRLDSVLFTQKFKDELQNFSLSGKPIFNKYNLGGHPSLYFEFSYIKSMVTKKGFFIATDINNSIFYILFTPDQKSFSKMFPIGREIISSVRIHNLV